MERTEPSYIFHRWCFISACAAILSRKFILPFGEKVIAPHQFIILVGSPAARKNSAIDFAKDLLDASGFKHFAEDSGSKEQFIVDWAYGFDKIYTGEEKNLDDLVMELNHKDSEKIGEAYVVAPELQDFFGSHPSAYIKMFTNMWDLKPRKTERYKKEKTVYISKPCLNLLGGTTPIIFNELFNDNIMGQGLLSRLILVYSDERRQKFTIAPTLPAAEKQEMIEFFRALREFEGELTISADALYILDKIYQSNYAVVDARLTSYNGRRYTHLLKVCLVLAATEGTKELTADVVILANTILTHTENFMPKALGEFGKSKNGEATQIILDLIRASVSLGGISAREIMGKVSQDVNSPNELVGILTKLEHAQRIQAADLVGKGKVYLPIIEVGSDNTKFTDMSLLWEFDDTPQHQLI